MSGSKRLRFSAAASKPSLMRALLLLVPFFLFQGPAAGAPVNVDITLTPLAGESLSSVTTWELCFTADAPIHRLSVGVEAPTGYGGSMTWNGCDVSESVGWLSCRASGTLPYTSVDASNSFAEEYSGRLFVSLSGNLGVADGKLNPMINTPVCVARLIFSTGLNTELPTSDMPSLLSPTYPDLSASPATLQWPYPTAPSAPCEEPVIVDGELSFCLPPADGAFYTPTAANTRADDQDGDLRRDEEDNCQYTANELQEDEGGLETNSADGAGDVCQCGEGEGTGSIFPQPTEDDLSNMLQYLREGTATGFDVGRCTVASASNLLGCSIHDAVVLDRALRAAFSEELENACEAYNPP